VAPRSFFLSTLVATLTLTAAFLPACSSSSDDDGGAPTPGADGGRRFTGQRRPTASCAVVLEAPELLPATHVPEGTVITYNSNPPSSGNHYPSWANFQEFDKPVDHGYLVHSMEHGAVVLFYKCDSPTGPGCAPLVEGLRKVRGAVKRDPLCTEQINARVIIVPDPRITTPVAAAAWGFTYAADCVDEPTLSTFIAENIALGPEDICAAGRAF